MSRLIYGLMVESELIMSYQALYELEGYLVGV